ncbi:hypothetical protein R3P38DRAFT_3627815 [Favolaschia claudopus]|uniref:Uncharacterized protein n=1 Tax=Favolaschia claudopus TaxID=2862362 RepID=A0AAW0A099_9AGAR
MLFSGNGLPVDDDILDRILTFCPTFQTLQSTMITSKSFYRVFQTHPKSITRAVAYNAVGPALPQALRVLRYPYDEYNTPDADPAAMVEACEEDHLISVITAEEKQKLQENSRIVVKLENIYSLRHKDRTSKTSLLTSEESWRFQRAMYRIMLFCNLFPSTSYSEDMDDECIEKIRRQRTAMLKEYPTTELQELHSVTKFLQGICEEVAPDASLVQMLLSTGPYGAMTIWENRSYDTLEEDLEFPDFDDDDVDLKLFSRYFSLPLENIWTMRKVTPPKDEDPVSKWILDQVNGANDTCSKCAAPGGLQLYTEANWDRFPIYLPNLLKHHLKQNSTITQPFYVATAQLAQPENLAAFIGDLFSFTTRTSPEFDGWMRTDSYCNACLVKFLEEHLWIWFLDERIKGGWTPPENCWYGWNCRTQVHKRFHAETKNHLCVPIKGDAI